MTSLNKRPSSKDFHVPANTVEFTEKHLETHLSVFNKDIYPEYFTEFEHKGLTYLRTQIIEESDLRKTNKDDDWGNQLYRPTKNYKYNAIQASVDTEGVDLRKKPVQVVAILDEKDQIVSIEYLFNGTTLNSVLDATILQNRLCAIYRKNSNFSIPNLIEIGANQNAIEKPFGANDDKTLEHCLKRIVDKGGYPLREGATTDEVSEWTTKLKASLEFMGGGYNMDSAKADQLIVDLANKNVGRTIARSVTSGVKALETLRKLGYVDTPTLKYGCISPLLKGEQPQFVNVYEKYSDITLKGTPEYYDFTKARYEVIIHGGAPDMSRPIDWFFEKFYHLFWKNYKKLNNFTSPNGFINNVDMRIIGALQPLECLNHIWPMDSIVTFEDIEEYYEKNQSNLGVALALNDVKSEDIDLTSFVYSDATLDTILCASEPPTFG